MVSLQYMSNWPEEKSPKAMTIPATGLRTARKTEEVPCQGMSFMNLDFHTDTVMWKLHVSLAFQITKLAEEHQGHLHHSAIFASAL